MDSAKVMTVSDPPEARSTAQPPNAPAEPAMRAFGGRLGVAELALGLMLIGGGAALAWALAELLAGSGRGAAPLAAALSVAVLMLPLLVLLLKLSRGLEQSRRELARLDTLDATTGVANRGHFLTLAGREWSRARRYGSGAALLLVDIDRFSRLIETRGAAAGDAVLRALAQHTEPTLRGGDALARFGGPQLAVWLAHADPIGALDVAERIRERIEALNIAFGDLTLRVTVSVGVAALRPAHQGLTALIEDADAAVLAARQTGGNCVRAAPVDVAPARKIGPSVGDNQAAGPV
jgi:diguanylate cyclase (GGDEF)-like protein